MDNQVLDMFIEGAVNGTLKFPEPLCKKCGDWGATQVCENKECFEFGKIVSAGLSADCKGCGIRMSEYFCECSY